MAYTMKEKREIALGAARAYLRGQKFVDDEMTWKAISGALDDLSRMDFDLLASQWYLTCSDHQWKLLYSDWNEWYKANI